MQQAVMEEEAAYDPPTLKYDDAFPALPESVTSTSPTVNQLGQWNNKMRIGSSVVTQVFRVPFEERKFDHSDKFGEGESVRTCSMIMKETGAHIEIASSKDMSLTFLVTGKQNAVLDARRKILTHFQTQASMCISIPKEHHRFILGKNGNKLKDLEKTTATKISVPNMADGSDKITITGTKEGIEKAVHEIRVTSDEQSKQAYERISVPKMYHPFICGAHNEKVTALMNETGVRINIPPLSVQKDEIIITGEKEGVMTAKERILSIYQEMEKKCTIVSVEVPKSQHKHVIGHRGNTIAEILQTTGVSVEMPPNDSSKGTITLRGPHDKLGLALNMVYEKAHSVITATVDAPNWIHKYIIGRKGANIRRFTQDLTKVHVEFTDKEDRIKIEGPPEEVERAQASLEDMARDLISKLTFVEMTVDPKYYKHIIGKNGANVNRMKDELGVVINIAENDSSNLIRIEGIKAGVEKAKQELEDMVHKLENEKERDIIIDHRFYRTIIGSKGDNIREIREMFNQVQITFPGPGENRDVVKIRGPKEDVDKCYKHLMKIVKELNESSYETEVPIYKQFHKFVIGKGGANIRKIRDETQTKIDLPAEGEKSDVITITGKKENVQEAKERILKIQNELVTIRGPKEDVMKAVQQLQELATERQLSSYSAEVRAKQQHHKYLIGKNGANIKKIRENTGARIVFPTDKDEDKEAITIIGKQEAVERAKAELEAIIKEIDNIVESDMSVEPRHHRHFVARRGEVLNRISDECDHVMISFPRPGVQSDRVVLKGAKDCIEMAKRRIQEIVADLESMVTIECIIPQKHHRTVMGAKGCKVQGITYEFCVNIKFPDRDAQEEYHNHQDEGQQPNGNVEEHEPVRVCDVIRITGKRENCEAAQRALLDLVPVTVEVNVPFDFHRSIIGQKGRDVRELMEKYDVHIVLSPADQRLDIIKISGTPACVERAKEAIEERCKELEAERQDRILKSFELKIEVDPEYHPKIIGRKGAVISKIRSDHGVQVNFLKKGDPEEHIITITGYEQNTLAARDDIMKIVNEWNNMVKEEVHIDARVHSRLIGARGRNIHKIMEQYSVDIKFPRSTDTDPNIVTVIGAEENVLDARDCLLNLEEEYMQDVNDAEMRESYRPSFSRGEDGGSSLGHGGGVTGFVVKGGPWEQRAPDTASTSEFPSFGGGGEDPQCVPSPSGAWGPRR
ncbi:Vigilin [Cryptotermes secundus]|uniref:Vigilin n=1 Tax=Cryptotermes secundus TaxID=105785 RepID=A0A2J7PPZ6_9NEOP|nr:vigilin isoform X2 [Cryptotermes secundus]PNF18399.1 Vigilin [Cryptotermes secundus]PNF18401.1 Vigilin [Cryptotermes secundus]